MEKARFCCATHHHQPPIWSIWFSKNHHQPPSPPTTNGQSFAILKKIQTQPKRNSTLFKSSSDFSPTSIAFWKDFSIVFLKYFSRTLTTRLDSSSFSEILDRLGRNRSQITSSAKVLWTIDNVLRYYRVNFVHCVSTDMDVKVHERIMTSLGMSIFFGHGDGGADYNVLYLNDFRTKVSYWWHLRGLDSCWPSPKCRCAPRSWSHYHWRFCECSC